MVKHRLIGTPRVGRPKGRPFGGVPASSGPRLAFTGSTTIAQGASSPDNVLTLLVLNNPAVNPYDSFEEVTDTDTIASLSDDEITIDTTSVIASEIVYKAVSSGGRPDLTITIAINITTVAAAGGDSLLLESGDYILLESGDYILNEAA